MTIYYNADGAEFTMDVIQDLADQAGVTPDRYIADNNLTTEFVPPKKELKPPTEKEITDKQDDLELGRYLLGEGDKPDNLPDTKPIDVRKIKKEDTRPKGFFESGKFGIVQDEEGKITGTKKKLVDKKDIEAKTAKLNLSFAETADETSEAFVHSNFDAVKLAKAGINKKAFAGFVNTSERYKAIKENLKNGVYKPRTNVYSDDDERALYEDDLNALLNDYIAAEDKKLNDKRALDIYNSSPEMQKKYADEKEGYFSSQTIIDDIYSDDSFKKVTQFDYKAITDYQADQFKNLTAFNTKTKDKLRKEYIARRDGKAFRVVDPLINLVEGGFEGGRDTFLWLGDITGLADNWAKRNRLRIDQRQKASVDQMDYMTFSGKSTTLTSDVGDIKAGTKVGMDESGQIYDLDNGALITSFIDAGAYKSISQQITNNGVSDNDFSMHGGATKFGHVVGGLTFQIAGAVGTGGLTSLASGTATAARVGSVLSKSKTAANILKVAGKNKQIVDATLFQSAYGAMNGNENTMKAAYNAGLTDKEADKLATQASLNMALLYGLTGPLAPKIPAMKAMDDFFAKTKSFDKIVNAYKKGGFAASQQETTNIFKQLVKTVKPTKEGAAIFTREGVKETVQENVQQAGEFLWVNRSVNEMAGQKIVKDEYSLKDIIETSILSFGAGGLVSRFGNLNNLGYNNNAVKDLYTLSKQPKSVKNRLDIAVETGKISREKADQIINDMSSVRQSFQNNTIPKYILDNDPDGYVKIANLQARQNELNKTKRNFGSLTDPAIEKELTSIDEQINTLAENARKKVLEKDVEIAQKFADVTVFENAKEAEAAGITELDNETEGLFQDSDGKIYINKDAASKSPMITVATHELLHKILKKQFNVNNLPTQEQTKVLEEFKDLLRDANLFDAVDERIQQYKEEGFDVEGVNLDEYFTAFSDILDQTIKEGGSIEILRKNKSLTGKLRKWVENILASFGLSKKFKKGEDVWDFIIDYQQNFQQGKLTAQAKAQLKAPKGKKPPPLPKRAKKSISRAELQKTKTKLNALKAGEVENSMAVKEALPNMINAQVNNLAATFDSETKLDFISDVYLKITSPNKAGKVVDLAYDGRGTVYGFINGRIRKRILDVLAEDRKRVDPLYVNQIQGDAVTRLEKEIADDVPTLPQDKTEFNIQKSFTPEQIQDIDKELLTIARVFTAQVTDLTLNKKTSDFIREFRKRAAKSQAVTLIKNSVKTGRSVDPTKFLNLKGAIVAGTTTTYLQGKDTKGRVLGGYPEVIEKSVGGQYVDGTFQPKFVKFPEWVGKKIDREKTSTDSAGRTAGHDLVRRVKKPANAITDQQFIEKSFTNAEVVKKGNTTRVVAIDKSKPIKPVSQNSIDSPITQLATEVLLSRFTTKLNETNNEISDAFEFAQEMKDQILAENYIANITMQAEQGGVKKSIARNKFTFNQAASALVKKGQAYGIDNIIDQDGEIFTDLVLPKPIGPVTKEELNKVTGYMSDGRIIPSLGGFVRNIFGLEGIVGDPIANYVSKVKTDPIIQDVLNKANLKFDFAITNKSTKVTKEMLNDHANGMNAIRQALGVEIGNILEDGSGAKLYGYSNRVLDAAKQKSDTGKPGPYYDKFIKGKATKSVQVPGVELGDVSIMNSQTGVMKKVATILQNSELTQDEKSILPQKLVDEIKAANVANIGLAKFIANTVRNLYLDGKISAVNVIAFYQQQTSADKGLRGLSTFNYFTAVGNIDQGKQKGEHLDANQVTMYNIMKATLDPSIADIQFESAIDEALMFHDQWLNNRSDLDIIDIAGRTVDAAELRMLIDAEGVNNIFTIDGIPAIEVIPDRIKAFNVRKETRKSIKDGQLPKPKKSLARPKNLNQEINQMIFRQKGVRPETTYSAVVARKQGAGKGRFDFFLPATAEDFRGLTSYTFAGKGKQGEADQKFFEDNLITPYVRGVSAMEIARQAFKNDYKTLLRELPNVKKVLNKTIPGSDFTHDQAVRVYLYTKSGFDVPGVSKRDLKFLNNYVANDPELKSFADTLQDISKRESWVEPNEFWDSGSILKDINDIDQTLSRKEYLAEFIENVDQIFDQKTFNKIEALYGPRHVEALKDIIRRMKSGSNRPPATGDRLTTAWLNWVNNSVGTIMFFNRRSALLQMISFANFTNWSDNNPLKAAQAFANQPAYWKAWVKIFNSPKLKQRRGGLKSDVQEQEIANQAKNSPNKMQAVTSYLLKIGFTPTQIADNLAIATGGATFLINRTKTYKRQGLSDAEAEAKAFEDFVKISDETQQSGDPMLISKQQSGYLGRFILSFQNTPMQYTRLMKKAGQDIINRRGDFKTNLSKIIYYGFVQNLIFATLQNALFALLDQFDPEDDEEGYERLIDKKTERIANSMVDTILRGSGLAGAVVSTLKNSILRFMKEEEKGFTADHAYTILELANVSPPMGSKLRKVYGAIQTNRFDKDIIEARGWEATKDGRLNLSPNYKILGNLASAGVNLPLDRAIAEVEAISEALNSNNTAMQRLALALGWRTWDVNIKNEDHEKIKVDAKEKRKEEGKIKAAETRKLNKENLVYVARELRKNNPTEYKKLERLRGKERTDYVNEYLKNNPKQ